MYFQNDCLYICCSSLPYLSLCQNVECQEYRPCHQTSLSGIKIDPYQPFLEYGDQIVKSCFFCEDEETPEEEICCSFPSISGYQDIWFWISCCSSVVDSLKGCYIYIIFYVGLIDINIHFSMLLSLTKRGLLLLNIWISRFLLMLTNLLIL